MLRVSTNKDKNDWKSDVSVSSVFFFRQVMKYSFQKWSGWNLSTGTIISDLTATHSCQIRIIESKSIKVHCRIVLGINGKPKPFLGKTSSEWWFAQGC